MLVINQPVFGGVAGDRCLRDLGVKTRRDLWALRGSGAGVGFQGLEGVELTQAGRGAQLQLGIRIRMRPALELDDGIAHPLQLGSNRNPPLLLLLLQA